MNTNLYLDKAVFDSFHSCDNEKHFDTINFDPEDLTEPKNIENLIKYQQKSI